MQSTDGDTHPLPNHPARGTRKRAPRPVLAYTVKQWDGVPHGWLALPFRLTHSCPRRLRIDRIPRPRSRRDPHPINHTIKVIQTTQTIRRIDTPTSLWNGLSNATVACMAIRRILDGDPVPKPHPPGVVWPASILEKYWRLEAPPYNTSTMKHQHFKTRIHPVAFVDFSRAETVVFRSIKSLALVGGNRLRPHPQSPGQYHPPRPAPLASAAALPPSTSLRRPSSRRNDGVGGWRRARSSLCARVAVVKHAAQPRRSFGQDACCSPCEPPRVV